MSEKQKNCTLYGSLSAGTLPLMMLSRVMGRKVFYMNAAGDWRNESRREWLKAWGIAFVPYDTFENTDPYKHLGIVASFAERLIDDHMDVETMNRAAGMFVHVDDASAKLRTALFDHFVTKCWDLGRQYAVAEKLNENGWNVLLHVITNPVSRQVFKQGLSRYPNTEVGIIPWIKNTGSLLNKVGRAVGRRLKAKVMPTGHAPGAASPAHSRQAPASQVLFFPHRGVAYSKLFRKDQFYSQDTQSPFHPDRITHCELAPVDDDVRAKYEATGTPYTTIQIAPVLTIGTLKTVKGAFGVKRLLIPGDIDHVLAGSVLVLYARFLGYRNSFAAFDKAKLALLGYELLFPKVAAMALQSHGIAIAATQERLIMAYRATSSLIADHYFVAGKIVREKIEQNSLWCVDHVYEAGLVRVDTMRKISPRWPAFDKPGKHKTLVLDYHSYPDPLSDNNGETISWANNKLFYEAIIRLARDFPDVDFVLRSKDAQWHDFDYFADVLKELMGLENLIVNENYENFDTSYAFAAGCDSIVCRHTSLVDEALALGKPVLCYERTVSGHSMVRGIYDYEGAPFFVDTYDALHDKFANIQKEGVVEGMTRQFLLEHYGPSCTDLVVPSLMARLEQIISDHPKAEAA